MSRPDFQILFSVNVSHSYFEKNICRCISFVPDNTTWKIVKRFDFRIRNTVSGFELYTSSINLIDEVLNYIKKAASVICFSFRLVINDSIFYSVTEMPINWIGQLIYDSQSDSNFHTADGIQLSEKFSKKVTTSYLGSINIYFNDIMKFGCDGRYTQFNISYLARSTQWQYYIINKNAVQPDNLTITGDTNIIFSGPENTIIGSGQQALLFTSGNTLIPLSEVPKYRFDLINKPLAGTGTVTGRQSISKMVYPGLPNPDPRRVGITQINSETRVSSPIYVYV